ncbi:hypothetical protein [Sphingomonas sp. Leaf21]|uniref:hypothetical protein n=1 Tax=Sphingomonas sp. Leaf21 TaxID=2876550 RepID=UPI001E2E7A50|nr:hypothetical protein [Sphingomonas sp. Leaf21]
MDRGESPCEPVSGDIRDQLLARIAALDVRAPYATAIDLAEGIEAIRRLAHAHGLTSAVTVTHFIDRALIAGDAPVAIHGWFAILTEAVDSDRQDLDAASRFAEACSLRLTG